jgi:hypothetical protein
MPEPAGSINFPDLFAGIYARWTLDCLVEIGYAVALDFVARPQLYVDFKIPDLIVDLRMSYGAHKHFPNSAQRQALMVPVFGRSDGFKPDATNASSSFQVARKKLVDACIAFSERAVDSGIPMLEERVRSALIAFNAHLLSLEGKSLQSGAAEIEGESNLVFEILRAEGVAHVFSVSKVNSAWPLGSDDPNGATLVESIGTALSVTGDCRLTHAKFMLLQRAAVEGALALPLALKTDPHGSEEQLLKLISQVYTWGTSLRYFQQAA